MINQKLIPIYQELIKHTHKHFLEKNFVPINSPKIVPFIDDEESHLIKVHVPEREGEKLFLSRSPQVYKEISCLNSLTGKVYEVGSVFRGEFSNNSRRANEFLGLDIEIKTNNLSDVIYELEDYLLCINKNKELIGILEESYQELDVPTKIKTIDYKTAVSLIEVDKLNSKSEKDLTRIFKELYGTGWVVITDFPATTRGFYELQEDKSLTNSFDLVNQWEICSGGMRRKDLDNYFTLLGKIGWSIKELQPYAKIINSFEETTGGFGIGIERLLGTIIKDINIKELQIYSRIPKIKIDF